jgi:hypothetical protein
MMDNERHVLDNKEMKPEEINRIIAEKIMGWKPENDCDTFRIGRCDGKKKTRCGACGGTGHGNCYGNGQGAVQVECNCIPNYCENISDAWMVLMKISEIEGIEIDININNNEPNYLNIDIYTEEEGVRPIVNCIEFELKEAPMAISLSAIKAMEGE